MQDIRELHNAHAFLPLIPETNEQFGQFTIEKIIYRGIFMGAKQYGILASEDSPALQPIVKMKGVCVKDKGNSMKDAKLRKNAYIKLWNMFLHFYKGDYDLASAMFSNQL